MRLVIDIDKLPQVIKDGKDNSFIRISNEELNLLFENSVLSDNPNSEQIGLMSAFSIRTVTSNKVLSIKRASSFNQSSRLDLGFIDYIRGEENQNKEKMYLVMANIRDKLSATFKSDYLKGMLTSIFQPIGIVKTKKYIAIYSNIIIEDLYELDTFNLFDNNKLANFEEISSIYTFTNLAEWSKIILSTLKIVENK